MVYVQVRTHTTHIPHTTLTYQNVFISYFITVHCMGRHTVIFAISTFEIGALFRVKMFI